MMIRPNIGTGTGTNPTIVRAFSTRSLVGVPRYGTGRRGIGVGVGYLGLGDVDTQQLIQQSSNSISQLISASSKGTAANIAAVGASTTVGILTSLSVISGPVGAVIGGLVGVGMAIASLFKGCGETCIQATKYANDAEVLLQQNLDHYRSLPAPRLKSIQDAAVNNAVTVMRALQQACSNPQLGAAGQRCISERLVRGGTAPWCPTGTGCDWLVRYLDPIANDPDVVPDPVVDSVSSSSPGGSPNTTTGSNTGGVDGGAATPPVPLIIAAGLILAAIAVR